MSSVVISETYLLVAAIIIGGILASAMAYGANILSDSMRAAWHNICDKSRVDIDAVFAFGSQVESYAKIYVKNVGIRSLQPGEIEFSDVYFGPRGSYKLVSYGGNSTPYWIYTIVNDDGDGIWEPGETIEITVYWTESLGPTDYYFRFVVPFDKYCEITFTPS